MTAPETVLRPSSDFESEEASLCYSQLDDLSRRLWRDVGDVGVEELTWQPAPGTNTIGMLLAHIAIDEVYWISVLTETAFLCQQVLGIGPDDDGMPLAVADDPPLSLVGRQLSYFQDLLMKAREHSRKHLATLRPEDLGRDIEVRGRTRVSIVNGRWILHHLVVHLASHHGQINLLRHLHRAKAGSDIS